VRRGHRATRWLARPGAADLARRPGGSLRLRRRGRMQTRPRADHRRGAACCRGTGAELRTAFASCGTRRARAGRIRRTHHAAIHQLRGTRQARAEPGRSAPRTGAAGQPAGRYPAIHANHPAAGAVHRGRSQHLALAGRSGTVRMRFGVLGQRLGPGSGARCLPSSQRRRDQGGDRQPARPAADAGRCAHRQLATGRLAASRDQGGLDTRRLLRRDGRLGARVDTGSAGGGPHTLASWSLRRTRRPGRRPVRGDRARGRTAPIGGQGLRSAGAGLRGRAESGCPDRHGTTRRRDRAAVVLPDDQAGCRLDRGRRRAGRRGSASADRRRRRAAGIDPALRHLHRGADRGRQEVPGLRAGIQGRRPDADRG